MRNEPAATIWLHRLDLSAPTLAQTLLDALAAPAAVLDDEGVLMAANRTWVDQGAGGPSFPPVGADYLDLCEHDDSPEGPMVAAGIRAVCRGRRASFELDFAVSRGVESSWFRTSARPLGAPIGGALVTMVDVTPYLQVADLMAERGLRDPLTGLANRALLIDHLQLALDRAARRDGLVAVAFVDLDDFKLVNDAYGHAAGDQLLRGVAGRLSKVVREEDTVARLGGDEFVVVFGDVAEGELALPLAQRLHLGLAEPITVAGRDHDVAASVGCTVSAAGATPESLLADADAAMYRAKRAGKNGVAVFSDDLRDRSRHRLEAEHELRRALERGQLRVQYQPIVDLTTDEVVGVEALLRWHHPERGVVAPSDFIPLAERLGLIVPIGRWVLEEACQQLARWAVPGLSLTVNVSPRQLTPPDFVDVVASAIEGSGIDPSRLCLELTETALMGRSETTVGVLHAIQGLGPHIAIDDFGIGWSSLGYLHRLPVEVLKVDRSFVHGLGQDPGSSAIVSAVLSLAHSLGLQVIAEGVETASQAAELVRLGCSIAQGFLYAPALPPEEIATLLGYGPRRPADGLRWRSERAPIPPRLVG